MRAELFSSVQFSILLLLLLLLELLIPDLSKFSREYYFYLRPYCC